MDNEISKEVKSSFSKETAVKEISDYFREEIKNGVLAPENILPSLQKISELFKADTHDVRDAMELLREEHLVKTVNGVGTIVLAENEWKRMVLLLPDITNWHYLRIYKAISYSLNYHQWQVDVKEHHGRLDLMSAHINAIANGDYFGAITAIPLAMLKKEDDVFFRLINSGFPLVFIGWGIDCNSVDDMLCNCGYAGTKHLIEQKYKRIGIIGSRSYDGEEFVAGCRKALEDAGMTDIAAGYAEDEEFAIKMLETWLSLEKRPDALFYQRSDYGEKCFEYLKSKKIQIGPEMGFIALDDTVFHTLTAPGPSAIRRFPDSIGKMAVDLFLELVALPKQERLVAKRVSTNFRLEPGRSTQKGPRGRVIYRAVNPLPNPQDMLNSYYPPAPPMPPGYWDGY